MHHEIRGKASFQGGLPAALLGLVLQWLMSLLISAIFVLVSNRIPELKQHWIAAGLTYGVGIFVVMGQQTGVTAMVLSRALYAVTRCGVPDVLARGSYTGELPPLWDGASGPRIARIIVSWLATRY